MVSELSGGQQSAPASSEICLECEAITAGYGDLEIVHGFSLNCSKGEIVGIIGPNGCGKSTFLKRVVGILPHRSGRVSVHGRDVTGFRTGQLSASGLHYVPQERDVFPSLTVHENLLIGNVDRSALPTVLDTFSELKQMLGRKAGRLSGGERKTLSIARAMMKPELRVLILDEPSAGLSPAAAERIWPLIVGIAEDGVAVVVVEQRVEDLLQRAARAYVMVEGRNVLEEPARVLLERLGDLAEIFMTGEPRQSWQAR